MIISLSWCASVLLKVAGQCRPQKEIKNDILFPIIPCKTMPLPPKRPIHTIFISVGYG